MENNKLNIIMNEFSSDCKLLLGDILADVRLYGSYARGDYDEESDIDVMLLLNAKKNEIRMYAKKICNIAAKIDMKYNVFISPTLQSKSFFEINKSISGFYTNVAKEGISFYV